MMNGNVIWFGASGHTCIYTRAPHGQNGKWAQGPDMKMADGTQLVCTDTSAILEPNGKVFVVTWSGTKGVVFLEYDPGSNQVTVVDGAPSTTNREAAKMLLLPNGHGLVWVADPTNALFDLAFDSGAQTSWAPKITSFPSTVSWNQTVTLTGTQLCGLSECQHFGDDNQQAENYPMVRFIDSRGGVTYARAHDVSTRSIAPGQSGSVLVDVPGLVLGTYSVEAVAMGLPSNRVTVDFVVSRTICQQLEQNIMNVILHNGPPYTVAGWMGVTSQLEQCVREQHLTQASVNAITTQYENWLKTRRGPPRV